MTVEGPSGESTPVSEFRPQIFYATIDTLLEEMNQRFNELNLTLLKSMQALVSNSSSFLHLDTLRQFLKHYKIPEAGVLSEIKTTNTFPANKSYLKSYARS